jgi:hypothetical protein
VNGEGLEGDLNPLGYNWEVKLMPLGYKDEAIPRVMLLLGIMRSLVRDLRGMSLVKDPS